MAGGGAVSMDRGPTTATVSRRLLSAALGQAGRPRGGGECSKSMQQTWTAIEHDGPNHLGVFGSITGGGGGGGGGGEGSATQRWEADLRREAGIGVCSPVVVGRPEAGMW